MDFVDKQYDNYNLENLKKLTVIIPTYNRNYYLSRCLWYLSHFPFGEIIVADSSIDEKKIINQTVVSTLNQEGKGNIKYLQFPPESEVYGGDIYKKWNNAIQQIETEYSVICTDKEFLIPTTLSKCIDFLCNNPDYNIVDAVFYLIDREAKKQLTFSVWRPNQRSLPLTDPAHRILLSDTNLVHPLMAVHRSDIHKKIYQYLDTYNVQSLGFGEIFLELLDVIAGKYHHMTTDDYLYRDNTNLNKIRGIDPKESSYCRYPKMYSYPDSLYNAELINVKMGLKDLLTEKSNISSDTAIELLNEFIPQYISHRTTNSEPLLLHYPALSLIWALIPPFIKLKLRIYVSKIRSIPNEVILKQNKEMFVVSSVIQKTVDLYREDKVDIIYMTFP